MRRYPSLVLPVDHQCTGALMLTPEARDRWRTSQGTVPCWSEKWLVFSDFHAPFHSPLLLPKICKLISDVRPEGVIIAGDFLDLFTLSKYAAGSLLQLKGITLDVEYDSGNQVLDALESAAGSAKKVFLFGNHEDRYRRTKEHGDNGKFGSALKCPAEALRLHERGWEVKDNWTEDTYRLGRFLDLTHGIYTNKYAARKHLDEFHGSVMFGHTHRYDVACDGERTGISIGCMCDINSEGFWYMPKVQRNKWVNGFGVVAIDPDGYYHASTVTAYNGRFFAFGNLY